MQSRAETVILSAMDMENSEHFQAGRRMLGEPVLPLVRILQLLFLTGPFKTVEPILVELTEPIETGGATYDTPGERLRPYLPLLKAIETLKQSSGADPSYRILTEAGEPADPFEALELHLAQHILTRELEQINSLLCGPCRCTLCCTGPDRDMTQLFFEIPLRPDEIALFPLDLDRIDTPDSRQQTSATEPALTRENRPFYTTGPALYHWRNGWSLILPRRSACPNLSRDGACHVYPHRPEVCRRPQIFSYVLERAPERDRRKDGQVLAAHISRRKLLAVWDCPYVRRLKDEIAAYAELCDLEPVFKSNKA